MQSYEPVDFDTITERLAHPSIYSGDNRVSAILEIHTGSRHMEVNREAVADALFYMRLVQDGYRISLSQESAIFRLLADILVAMSGMDRVAGPLESDLDLISTLVEEEDYQKARVVLDGVVSRYGKMIGEVMRASSLLFFLESGYDEDVTDDPAD